MRKRCIFILLMAIVFWKLQQQKTNKSLKNSDKYGCSKTTVPRNREHKLTALASFMGSGNTWTRELLQEASGYWTGSIYPDLDLVRHHLVPEFDQINCEAEKGMSKFVAVKTHMWPSWKPDINDNDTATCQFERAIVIIRNPFDALVSEFQRKQCSQRRKLEKDAADGELMKVNPHTFTMSKEEIKNHKDWPSFVKDMTDHWLNLVIGWLEFSEEEVLVVCYEVLRQQPKLILDEMMNFLGLHQERMYRKQRCDVNFPSNFNWSFVPFSRPNLFKLYLLYLIF